MGSGRVGAVLGHALQDAGHTIVATSGISAGSRDRAAALLPEVPLVEVAEVVRRAELVVLAVPDDALAGLVRGLAAVGAWRGGQIAVHTSGRFGAGVLDPAREAGVLPLAIHPAMTFTGTAIDLSRLAGATFAVTAPGPVLPIGQALVVEIGGEPVVLDESMRPLYHAALAHGANHLVVLIAQAAEALGAAGIERPGRLLGPLLTAALDNAVRHADKVVDGGPGAIDALTGPVSRGDVETVAEHVAVLEQWTASSGASDVLASYAQLSRGATRRALTAGRIGADTASAVLDILDRVE